MVSKAIATAFVAIATLGIGITLETLSGVSLAADPTPYKVSIDPSGSDDSKRRLSVGPHDRREWSEYIAANSQRMEEWIQSPLPPDYFQGKFVTVTFSRPVNLEEYYDIVTPLVAPGGRIRHYIAVARNSNGRWGSEWTFQPPTEQLYEERVTPPNGNGNVARYTIEGIMASTLFLGDHTTAELLLSVSLRDEVYLVDTTVIPIEHTFDGPFDAYHVASPYFLLDKHEP